MSLVISVYSREAYREFLLPSINNADHSMVLHRSFFGLKEDLSIRLEILDGIWRICPGDNYLLYQVKRRMDVPCPLHDQDMFRIVTTAEEQISLLIQSVERPLSVFRKFGIAGCDQITIGRNEKNMIQYNNRDLVAREHAVLVRKGSGWEIRNQSTNGLYVNGSFMKTSQPLEFGDYINIVGLHMVFMGDVLAIDAENKDVVLHPGKMVQVLPKEDAAPEESALPGKSKILFHRAPRNIEKIETDPVEIEDPPNAQKGKKQPLLLTIGPSFTMAIPMLLGCLMMIYASRQNGGSTSLFMYSGLVMAGSSALIGVTWALFNLHYQKKTEIEEEEHRYEAFGEYLIQKKEEVKEKYEHNQNALREMYPDAFECIGYNENTVMLWGRNITHEDFLKHRLGIGDIDFQAPVLVSKEKFRLYPDSLGEKPRMISENFHTLYQVPVLTDLMEHRLIGLVGGEGKKGAVEIAKVLTAQIAANNCYTDVKLVYIYNDDDSDDLDRWGFAKWLPHVWSEDKKFRYVASSRTEASDVFYEITNVLRQRTENPEKKGGIEVPWFVMFISDISMIENELIAKYIFDNNGEYGLSVLILSDTAEHLPNSCEYIIEKDSWFRGMYNVSEQKEARVPVTFDQIEDEELERFARRLSNIEVQETENGGEIPATLTFFDMYGISTLKELRVEERWLKNRTYDNIRGLIGQKAGGAPCYMDVHEKYHGPHGLVAGTTGSGKSETLQTYMLSLAINYSPDDIGFFIIDYKGGGMANLFEGLPHMIGQISNLSGNQVRRAMVSIKSENRRRQQIFNEHDVNNINAYTKLYKNAEASVPVPHLFIIIDEFAELKKEEPDFMKELISVAQVGRSLGVHLILATQKPSGTVDDNIWSNSKFRLCLRVQDRQDSNDMLHKPDAAYITQAGRCYLQVGNDEVYELFQSGWSGAPYNESTEGQKTEIARVLTMTGKADLVGSHARTARKEKELYTWIEKLAQCFEAVLKGTTNAGSLNGKGNTDLLIHMVYKEIAARGLDYPEGKYNSARLEDMGRLYEEAVRKESGDIPAYIIKEAALRRIRLPEAKERTQLDAVKDHLAKVAAANGYTHNHQLWLPVLPERLYLSEFEEHTRNMFGEDGWKEPAGAWSLDLIMGRMDDPVNQAQMPLSVSFPECGHIAVCGSVVSGKSTFLQTLVYGMVTRYSPRYVNIYALDFSSKMMSAFEGLAHVGGVMYEGDQEKIGRFFTMISGILEERKKVFRGGNYAQYVQVHGVTYPAILIIIDNYSALKEKTKEAYEDILITLSREGVSHGIFLVVSGAGFGMNDISSRVAENLQTVICLEMADKFAYGDVLHTMRIDVLPEVGIKGRGLAYYGTRLLEFQTALALEAEDDYQRMERISDVCEKMNRAWTGRPARQVPTIPEEPVWTEFSQLEEVVSRAEEKRFLPVGYNAKDADIYSVDLSRTYCYLITGNPKSGKKNFMKIMILSALLKGAEVCIIDTPAMLLRAFSSFEKVSYVNDEEQLFRYFQEKLTPVFQSRNKKKNALLQDDYEEADVFREMSQETPVFLFIPDMEWFLDTVYASSHGMKGFVETLFNKGALHNIYFVGVLPVDKKGAVNGYQAFQYFVRDKNGIHFGGNVMKNSMLSYDYLSYQEQNKPQKPGIGMLPDIAGEHPVEKIVVPLARWK